MATDTLYFGNALSAVDADGMVALPRFIQAALKPVTGELAIILGSHELDPCITAYDAGHLPTLQAEIERRRLRDEAASGAADAHYARLRRAFGMVEHAALERGGAIAIPPMIRLIGRIEESALFIGLGATFEIWNPHLAREAGSRDLRELAKFRLNQEMEQEI